MHARNGVMMAIGGLIGTNTAAASNYTNNITISTSSFSSNTTGLYASLGNSATPAFNGGAAFLIMEISCILVDRQEPLHGPIKFTGAVSTIGMHSHL